MIKSILNKKSIISLGATFLMVACATNDGVPQLVSSSAIQEQSEVTWNSLLESRELSASVDLTQRFERVSSQLIAESNLCLLYTSPSPRDRTRSRMPSSA